MWGEREGGQGNPCSQRDLMMMMISHENCSVACNRKLVCGNVFWTLGLNKRSFFRNRYFSESQKYSCFKGEQFSKSLYKFCLTVIIVFGIIVALKFSN